MTPAVADFLAHRVFCDAGVRVSAHEFGAWARALPDLLGPPVHGGHRRVISTSSTHAHPLASAGPSSRPVSRAGSIVPALRTPALRTRTLSRGASDARGGEAPALAEPELSTILDECPEVEEAAEHEAEVEAEAEAEAELDGESRSQSTTKRRKRGARKGKAAAAPAVDLGVLDDKLNTLAAASQTLARELSRQTRLPHTPPMPPAAVATPPPPMLKKTSKWKLSFGKSAAPPPPPEEPTPPARTASATASNVSSLIMGLGPGAPKPPSPVSMFAADDALGRRAARPPPPPLLPPKPGRGRPAPIQGFTAGVLPPVPQRRGASPTSTRSGRSVASSTQNWRAGMGTSSAATSTSAFTRFSNGSASTVATSVSADSWRGAGKPPPPPPSSRARSPLADATKPVNVKRECIAFRG
jgi:hypothetical protein